MSDLPVLPVPQTTLELVAAHVRAMRAFRGLTQRDAATRAGISAGYWSRIETATADGLRMDIVERIIKALDGRLMLALVPRPDAGGTA